MFLQPPLFLYAADFDRKITNMRSFGSDNNASVHPKIMEALTDANRDQAPGYGDDEWTQRASESVRSLFDGEVLPLFVYNGTGSNMVALQLMTRSYNSILCAETAHIAVDECNAPGKFTGSMLRPVDTPDGKLTPELLRPYLTGFGFEHHSQPGALYVSQCTELGTVYTPEELKALVDFVHGYGLKVHLDGARIANAAVSLGVSIKEISQDCGVDTMTLGGTKNGLMFGECVVVFDKSLFDAAKYVRKQSGQLASKMRYISAQFSAYLENGLWLECAAHANRMAGILYRRLSAIPGIVFTQKVQSNQLFLTMPKKVSEKLSEDYFFYYWNEAVGEVRFVTSFDTVEKDIDNLVAAVETAMK